jgi:hypothetical protein
VRRHGVDATATQRSVFDVAHALEIEAQLTPHGFTPKGVFFVSVHNPRLVRRLAVWSELQRPDVPHARAVSARGEDARTVRKEASVRNVNSMD